MAVMGGMASRWDYDAAVIGGGPGGSSAATALARRGRSVVVLERERFPRFHIGESQLPWTNGILHALGVRDTVAASGFVEKWGASFRGPDGRSSGTPIFKTPRRRQRLRRFRSCGKDSTRFCSVILRSAVPRCLRSTGSSTRSSTATP
jgi:2-polyprenyl-6-methoxyphenol hydroxylase-like FAD-dependent oxidoreductase